MVYSPELILSLVRENAAGKLGVKPFEISLKPTNLGPIKVAMLPAGRPLGPFFRTKLGALKVADRIDDEGDVLLEDPFYFRGEYPVTYRLADFLKLRAAPLRHVRAEFIRLARPFPPRGWEHFCGISAKAALQQLQGKRKEAA